MKHSSLAIILGLFWTVGCGGSEEDFSKPPAAIQQQLSRGKTDPGNEPNDGVSTDERQESGAAEAESPTPSETAAAKPDLPADTPVADTGNVPASSGKDASTEIDGANAGAGAKSTQPEVTTASGKSEDEIAEKREANSKKSVAGNAGGLLSSLKGKGDSKGAVAVKTPGPDDSDIEHSIARFGRFSLSRRDWLHLVTQLTRRFFIAATPDGSRLAASSGERSAGVVNPQLNLLFQPQGSGNRNALAEPMLQSMLQSITALPGLINAVELTGDGNLVLLGTTDGRLLVRSTASSADWDLYARDLFLFQDEHRKTSRLSTEAIVVVRCLPNGKVLTIDGNGTCVLWKLNDAVHAVTPILEMTVEEARSPEAITVSAEPVESFAVAGFQILSVSVDESGQLGAIVTSAEEVTLFNTETGTVTDTLKAEHFADTQPVCVEFIPERSEILVGLADGRILRRAFGDATPVSGTDDQGEPVDYDAVFIPDLKDRRGAITCLALVPRTNQLYFGSVDGQVSRLDISQRRLEQTIKRHEGPVFEFRLTPGGVLSIGRDRKAVLFDIPLSVMTVEQNPRITIPLPNDETLQDETIEEDEATIASRKSTRPVRSAAAGVERPDVDLSLAGIRPADAILALYEHQLRAATNPEQRLTLQKQILMHRGQNSAAESLGTKAEEISAGAPLRIGEVTTEFNFGSGVWSRVLLSVSDNGTLVAAVHRAGDSRAAGDDRAKAVTLWDLATGSALRRWTQPGAMRRLGLQSEHHLILPIPGMAKLSTADGRYLSDPENQFFSGAVAPDRQYAMLGHFGRLGTAGASLTRIELADGTSKSGLELFESMVSAVEVSSTGETVFVSTRERDQTRLMEVDSLSFAVRHEISKDELKGAISSSLDAASMQRCGAVVLVSSPDNRMLLTWGEYDDGPQLRLWRRINNRWPAEDVVIVKESDAALELAATDRPAAFVNHQESRVALITRKGVVVINTKKAKAEGTLPIPDVGSHRPVCQFSPDNNWVLMGDGEGNIWAATLSNLQRKPIRFSAHSGPVVGMAFSADGRCLVTAGEDNRLRSWRVDGFLKR